MQHVHVWQSIPELNAPCIQPVCVCVCVLVEAAGSLPLGCADARKQRHGVLIRAETDAGRCSVTHLQASTPGAVTVRTCSAYLSAARPLAEVN